MSTTASSGPERDLCPHTAVQELRTSPIAGVLLILASTLFVLFLSEIGLRMYARLERAPAGSLAEDKKSEAGAAMDYLSHLPALPGTDRAWFPEDPPPLPNRSTVSAQRLERFRDFEKRGIFAPQADYLWNRYYVESERCSANNLFQNYPGSVLAFNPPEESLHPRYRFPPDTTTIAGLVTNEFGLRGPPLGLSKPPRTVRIAFIGASTTVDDHTFRFSYPELVTNWLNRFAQVNHVDVHFEGLNAGREGINSEDIAAIVRQELLPLSPDIAVYYEGSNQFSANRLVSPRIMPRQEIDPLSPVVEHWVPLPIRTHLALGDLLDRALNRFHSTSEPPKPAYRLMWPAGVDQRNPDVDNPNLPLELPAIVKDLDSIRTSLASMDGQLVLCSFEWLAKNGMPLSPTRHQFIYKHLNTSLWPLRYADIRRLADFQNRVFRRYASVRKIPFLDVASALPQDPNLFVDAIHMNEAGDRLRAWVVFQQLVPLIRSQIESGRLPRNEASIHLPPPPSLAASEMTLRCTDVPSGPLERIPGGASIATLEPAYNGGSVQYGNPVKVITGEQQWSYAALFPIEIPAGLSRPCYVFLRARVLHGQIGLGVHDSNIKTLQLEKAVDPSSETVNIYVPVLFPKTADTLVVRNVAPGGIRSEILIEDVQLLAFLKPLPEEMVKTLPLDQVKLVDQTAALERNNDGLGVTTGPGQGAYAGRLCLGLDRSSGEGLTVKVSLRVLEGNLGVGILTPDSKAFILERSVWPTPQMLEVALPLPSPPITGDLIIRNLAAGHVASKAIMGRIEIHKTR